MSQAAIYSGMAHPIVFVHGGGEGGEAAWPLQAAHDFGRETRFIYRPGFAPGEAPRRTDFGDDARAVLAACGSGAHVVAHSYGSLAALRAAELDSSRVLSMILLEPTAFGLVRGDDAVEGYIEALSVMERASSMGPADYFVALLTAMGVPEVPTPATEAELLEAERWRLLAPPWDAPVSASAVAHVPTLLVSGGWNPAQDVVDDHLAGKGATRTAVPGAGHMVQYADGINEVIRDFIGEIEADEGQPQG